MTLQLDYKLELYKRGIKKEEETHNIRRGLSAKGGFIDSEHSGYRAKGAEKGGHGLDSGKKRSSGGDDSSAKRKQNAIEIKFDKRRSLKSQKSPVVGKKEIGGMRREKKLFNLLCQNSFFFIVGKNV